MAPRRGTVPRAGFRRGASILPGWYTAPDPDAAETPMLCPECRKPLVIVECEHVELDACFQEHGLWFDTDELQQLFELAGAPEALHDLEARLEKLPAHRHGPRRRCPRCRARMRHVGAPGGEHAVILDRCPRGCGLWFDEGELHEVLTAGAVPGDPALETLRGYLGVFVAPRQEKES